MLNLETNGAKCPACGYDMRVARSNPYELRPEYKRQILECIKCGQRVGRVVDAKGNPVESA